MTLHNTNREMQYDEGVNGITYDIKSKSGDSNRYIFEDSRSKELLKKIRHIGRANVTALIIGETGTGKEWVARHMHEVSGRNGPFIPINCAAFNESLADAELFGHESGAFTGATHTRKGWFEAAQGGTIFLDEIGDMSLGLQVKLLRVLQERQVVPIGARKPVQIDTRIIAATNVNLLAAVDAGRFRADLFYRLNVAVAQLIPLRNRRGDIVPLIDQFIQRHGANLGFQAVSISPEAVKYLCSHHWPGNVRQLENVIQYALIDCTNGYIDEKNIHIADEQISNKQELENDQTDMVGFRSSIHGLLNGNFPNLYETVEREVIKMAFDENLGNQIRTAKALGISRSALRVRLKRLGIQSKFRLDRI
jgi:sigma-54-specific transcriptional regulator